MARMRAVASFQRRFMGHVLFEQNSPRHPMKITVRIRSKRMRLQGLHGFHVHTKGDLRAVDCSKCGGHWNPRSLRHGGLRDNESHAGDLGNLAFHNSEASLTITTSKLTLFGEESIVGRSVVVHRDADDEGKGGDDESLRTGNAGPRLECAVIGYG